MASQNNIQPMTFEDLFTDRLILRKITPEIQAWIYGNYDDPEIMELFGFATETELNVGKEKYAKGLSMHNRSSVNFLLLDKDSGKTIGGCGFHTWYPEHLRAEIGYAILNDELKGKGLMSEAMAPIIDYGFNRMNLNRIEALIGPGNTPSIKLVTKFGFVKEGYLREHYNKKGEIQDSLAFSLLRREYKPLR
jgi:ribosomal-protein-alanine N-acetyltransferase